MSTNSIARNINDAPKRRSETLVRVLHGAKLYDVLPYDGRGRGGALCLTLHPCIVLRVPSVFLCVPA